jgi:hypothetical protein
MSKTITTIVATASIAAAAVATPKPAINQSLLDTLGIFDFAKIQLLRGGN